MSWGQVRCAKDAGAVGQQIDGARATGPYAFVRHPMYVGVLIMVLGVPPALGSWWASFSRSPAFPC